MSPAVRAVVAVVFSIQEMQSHSLNCRDMAVGESSTVHDDHPLTAWSPDPSYQIVTCTLTKWLNSLKFSEIGQLTIFMLHTNYRRKAEIYVQWNLNQPLKNSGYARYHCIQYMNQFKIQRVVLKI